MLSYGHVFISYARVDSVQAHRVRHDLETAGFSAWIDEAEIHAGSVFTGELEKGIANAAAVAVVLTAASAASEWVRRETLFSINRKVPVIPLCFADATTPIHLEGLQFIDFQSSYQAGMEKLEERLPELLSNTFQNIVEARKSLLAAQQRSPSPERFQDAINALTEEIGGWEDRIGRQRSRVDAGLQLERERSFQEMQARRSVHVERVVGPRPPDAGDYFKDRVAKLNDMGRLLEKPATPVVSVTGRSGIGKTALAVKVIGDLEKNKWPHTAQGPVVHGIAYLATGVSTGISLEQIFLHCSRMMADPSLEAVWKSATIGLEEKISMLLDRTCIGRYILLLDHVDDLLDQSSRIAEPQLSRFLELTLARQSGLHVITTSREQISFPDPRRAMFGRYERVSLGEGLPLEQAIELLREMDPQGDLRLASANDHSLEEIVKITHGIPRALQLFASILENDPFLSAEQLRDTFMDSKDVVRELVQDNYSRLDDEERLVMVGLTVFQRAVTVLAVDYLLQEFGPGLDVPAIIRRLVRTHTVTVDRVTQEIALHPVDRDWICSLQRNAPQPSAFPTLAALNRRAASYYQQKRFPSAEWTGLEHVEPQWNQIQHLFAAGDFAEALAVLDEIDQDYLEIWGYYQRVIHIRERIAPHVAGRSVMENLARLGRLHALAGDLTRARGLFEEALGIARQLADAWDESLLLWRLGSCAHDLGEGARARALYQQALAIAQMTGDPLYEGMQLYGLGRCARAEYKLDEAVSRFEDSMRKLAAARDHPVQGRRPPVRPDYLIAHALNNLGLCHRARGEPGPARKKYELALVSMQQIHDRGGQAYVMTNLASLDRMEGSPEEAMRLCREALDIYVNIQDRWGEASTYRIMGALESDLGRAEQATQYHEQALRLSQATGNRTGTGITQVNMAMSALRAGRYGEAVAGARNALDTLEAAAAVRYQSHAAVVLAWGLLLDGRPREAQEVARTDDGVRETGPCRVAALGAIAMRQNAMAEAERMFRDTLTAMDAQSALAAICGYRYLRAWTQAGLALSSGGSMDEPLELYRTALRICAAPGVLDEQRAYLAAFGTQRKLDPIAQLLAAP